MKCLRNVMLASVMTLATVLPLANPPAAQATPQQRPQQYRQYNHTQRIYWVYYRSCPNSAWVCYGGYYHGNQATQAVTYFRNYGYDAYYRAGNR